MQNFALRVLVRLSGSPWQDASQHKEKEAAFLTRNTSRPYINQHRHRLHMQSAHLHLMNNTASVSLFSQRTCTHGATQRPFSRSIGALSLIERDDTPCSRHLFQE